MNKKYIIVFLAGFLFFLTGIARARVSDMTVGVDGMSCPFCAFGVEKRLKTVKGVASVIVDMKTGTAKLTAKAGISIHYPEVPKAIKEAGFTAGVMKITLNGTVAEKDSSFLLQIEGATLAIETGNDKMSARLRGFAGSGKSVVLHGVLNRESATSWSVAPESIEEVAQ